MKKEEKDIIQHITEKLKSTEEFAYREGAWEKFKEQHEIDSRSKVYHFKRWSSVAAALILLGAGSIYYFSSNDDLPNELNVVNRTLEENSVSSDNDNSIAQNNELSVHPNIADYTPISPEGNSPINDIYKSEINIIAANSAQINQVPLDYNNINIEFAQPTSARIAQSANFDQSIPTNIADLNNGILSVKQVNGNVLAAAVIDKQQSKRILWNNKFDLGLFVSPNATSEKTNMGGGLMIAYNLTKNLSIRTGAAYNTYTVGRLKDPTQANSVEPVSASSASASRDMSYSSTTLNSGFAVQNNVILPNINAVTGLVQSIDIPLEVKYNMSKSLYATAGASYSAIINQERNAQYIENVNMETFSDGFPENDMEMARATKAVTKTVKSLDNNVNTNGFNGFVNFSVGKKVGVKNKVGLAVEPYVKIPVGQYRKSDMDYTNAGLRIITTF